MTKVTKLAKRCAQRSSAISSKLLLAFSKLLTKRTRNTLTIIAVLMLGLISPASAYEGTRNNSTLSHYANGKYYFNANLEIGAYFLTEARDSTYILKDWKDLGRWRLYIYGETPHQYKEAKACPTNVTDPKALTLKCNRVITSPITVEVVNKSGKVVASKTYPLSAIYNNMYIDIGDLAAEIFSKSTKRSLDNSSARSCQRTLGVTPDAFLASLEKFVIKYDFWTARTDFNYYDFTKQCSISTTADLDVTYACYIHSCPTIYQTGSNFGVQWNCDDPKPATKELEVQVEWKTQIGDGPLQSQPCANYKTNISTYSDGKIFSNKDSSCGFTEKGMINPDASQIKIISPDFSQLSKEVLSDTSTKKVIKFTNINKIIPPKKNLEIRVRWQIKEGATGTPVVQPCASYTSKVKATDSGATKVEQTTGCGFKVGDIVGKPDASQTQIISTGFKEIKKEVNDSDPNNVIITFTNEKIVEPKKDLEIIVKWQLRDALSGNITLLNCSQYQSQVKALASGKTLEDKVTSCGYSITGISEGGLDAEQPTIYSDGFKQISKTGPIINGTTTTITFINEKILEPERFLVIKVKWQIKVGENGTPVEQACSKYRAEVDAKDNGTTKVKQDTDCGFTVGGIKGTPSAEEPKIHSEGFYLKEILKPVVSGTTTTITIINEKIVEPEPEPNKDREVELQVRWYDKDERTGARTRLNCGDFLTYGTILNDGKDAKSQDTCNGFKATIDGKFDAKQSNLRPTGFTQFNKIPEQSIIDSEKGTDLIILENERIVKSDVAAKIIVEWYEEDASGSRTKLNCGDYLTKVGILGTSNQQDTCAGFSTDIPKATFDAVQDIQTEGFTQFDKIIDSTSLTITFKNVRKLAAQKRKINVVVEWYENDNGSRTQLPCVGNIYESAITLKSETTNTCAGFTVEVSGSGNINFDQKIKTPGFSEFDRNPSGTSADLKDGDTITFKNEKMIEKPDLEIKVKWYIKEGDNEPEEQNCRDYSTDVTVDGDTENTDCGYVKTRVNIPTAKQNIKTPEFVEFETEFDGSNPKRPKITFKNIKYIEAEERMAIIMTTHFETREYGTEKLISVDDCKGKFLSAAVDEYYGTKHGVVTTFECQGFFDGQPTKVNGRDCQGDNWEFGRCNYFIYNEAGSRIDQKGEGYQDDGHTQTRGNISQALIKFVRYIYNTKDLEVKVNWQKKKGDKIEPLNCSDYQTRIEYEGYQPDNIRDDELTSCGFYKGNFAVEKISAKQKERDLPPGFTQVYDNCTETEDKVFCEFTNQIEENTNVDLEVRLRWREVDSNGNITAQYCHNGESQSGGDREAYIETFNKGPWNGIKTKGWQSECSKIYTAKELQNIPEPSAWIAMSNSGGLYPVHPYGYIQYDTDYNYDDPNKTIITFYLENRDPKKNGIEVQVKWYTNGNYENDCDQFSSEIVISDDKDPSATQTKRTGCGFFIPEYGYNVKAIQESMTPGFKERKKSKTYGAPTTYFDSQREVMVFIFENEREDDEEKEEPENLKVIINWQLEDALTGKISNQNCNDFRSDVNIMSKDKIFARESVVCTVDKSDVPEPDALQIMETLPEGYVEIDRKVVRDSKAKLTTVTITNQKTDYKKEDFEIRVKWQIKEGNKAVQAQDCNKAEFKTSVALIENTAVYATKFTNCGFIEKNIANPDASQENILTEGYRQIDRIDSVEAGRKVITFINQKEMDPPNVDFEVRIKWQIKEGNAEPVPQDCGKFLSIVNILENGHYFSDRLSSCGFKESNLQQPDAEQYAILSEGFEEIDKEIRYEGTTKVVTFTNQSGELPLKDIKVEVEWYKTDANGNINPDPEDCSTFKTKVKVTDEVKKATVEKANQETGCGFEVKDVTDPEAEQSIITEGYTQFEKKWNADKTLVVFKNKEGDNKPKDVKVEVKWRIKGETDFLDCNQYKSHVIAFDGEKIAKEEDTGCGFEVKDVVKFGASQDINQKHIDEGFSQVSKLTNEDETLITFINEKSEDPIKDVQVIVEWFFQDGMKPAVQQTCGDFQTSVNVFLDGKQYSQGVPNNTCAGFLLKNVKVTKQVKTGDFVQHIKTADFKQFHETVDNSDPKKIVVTFQNKRISTLDTKKLIVHVKWQKKDFDEEGEPYLDDTLDCKEYVTTINVTNDGKDMPPSVTDGCGLIRDNVTEPNAIQQIQSPGFEQINKIVDNSDPKQTVITFVNELDATSNLKTLKVNLVWKVQKSIFKPSTEQNCKDYKSLVRVEDKKLLVAEDELSCSETYTDVVDPDALQKEIISEGFKEIDKKVTGKGSKNITITFTNLKCLDGQWPEDPKDDCLVEEMPPYIGIPGIVNPTYPETGTNPPKPIWPVDPNKPTPTVPTIPGGEKYPGSPTPPTTGVVPGKPGEPGTGGPGGPGGPGEPSNPIFVPPNPINEVPTQVSDKPFKPKFVEPNINIKVVPPSPDKDWPYEVEYYNPYKPSECYNDNDKNCKPSLPIDSEEDFRKWIGGQFYVYLLDVVANEDYIANCQKQASNENKDKNADFPTEKLTSVPFYYKKGQVYQPSSNKDAPQKIYALTLGLNKRGGNPYQILDEVQIPDAHQKLSFMIRYVPDSSNPYVLPYNICNVDTFALRPAYFVAKTENIENNMMVDGQPYKADKARVVSSSSYNLDIHSKVIFPSAWTKDGIGGFGVPNYINTLSGYKLASSHKDKVSDKYEALANIASIAKDVVVLKAIDLKLKPYIKPSAATCTYKKDDICTKGLCNEEDIVAKSMSSRAAAPKTTLSGSSRRSNSRAATLSSSSRNSRAAAPIATRNPNKGSMIWTDNPMLIEASFGYYKNGVNAPLYAKPDAATKTAIKNFRTDLSYFKGKAPTLKYDALGAFDARSIISTTYLSDRNKDLVFAYNNVGDAEIEIIDNSWTEYDQLKKDAVGRARAEKCIIGDATNTVNGGLVGCNVAMANKVSMTFVPDYIEVNPQSIKDKISKDSKNFTYFANKLSKDNIDNIAEAERLKEMYASYNLDASAYVSDEIYGTPISKFDKKYPLLAYGYENVNGLTCGKDVNYLLDFSYDCSDKTFKDRAISTNIEQRCAADITDKDYCKLNPLDSRCHNRQSETKNYLKDDLKKALEIFNLDKKDGDKFKLSFKEFTNGVATKNNVYFNFARSKNFATSPKIININDFYVKDIVQVGFTDGKEPLKNFIRPKLGSTTEQVNTFEPLSDKAALGKNAHFYYGYVNSEARKYLLCSKGDTAGQCEGKGGVNPVDVDIMIHADLPYCDTKETKAICSEANFLDIFKKDNYLQERRMYKNPYDNYSKNGALATNNLLTSFVSKYESQHEWSTGKAQGKARLIPSKEAQSTTKAIQRIEFADIPENFSQDLENVNTSDYFVYSDGRGIIPDSTPFNIFELIYKADQGNTWGGEGSTKSDDYDKVGSVPMDQSLSNTSKNLNRRIR